MPRRNRPKRKPRPAAEPETSPTLPVSGPPGWHVRTITAERAIKDYRCPGCEQVVRQGVAHVVAWRTGDDEGRRHWHRPCWQTWAKRAR